MKVLPHSLEAERGLLGSILISPIILKELASLIDVDYFYDSDNKKIAEKILSLFSSNKTIDILTVSNALE
jgi:replicative DNA helicase